MASELEIHREPHREAPTGKSLALLRPFERKDEPEVRDLLVRCLCELAPPSLEAQLEAYIARTLAGDYRDIAQHYRPGRGRGFWLCVSRDGDLMGTFALQPAEEDVVELRRMYVDAEFRRRGVAWTMLAKAEALCAGWGFRRLFLTTSTLNQAAIELYRRAGYGQSDYVAGTIQDEPIPPGVKIFTFEKVLTAG